MSCALNERENARYSIPPAIASAPPLVREGSSSPADPEAPSFLLLPAELRNEIYALTLIVPDTLVIASGRLYRCLSGDGDGDGDNKVVDMFEPNGLGSEVTPSYIGLYPAAHPGQHLFATCRQVYCEASSVFFARNTFEISKPERDLSRSLFRGPPEAPAAHIASGVTWLINLGSQLSKLCKVTIDLDNLLYKSRETTYQWTGATVVCLEIVDLLRLLWNRHVNVQFRLPECTKSKSASGQQADASNPISTRENDVLRHNLMIKGMQRDDLGIRKLARVICHVLVHRSGTRGIVVFRSTHPLPCQPENDLPGAANVRKGPYHPCFHHRLNFRLDSDGRIRRIQTPPLNLMRDLPMRIRDRIVHFILHHNDLVNVALDNKLDNGPGWMYVNKATYKAALPRYYTVNDFILHMQFKSPQPVLVDVKPLDKWMTRLGPSEMSASNMAGLRGRNVRKMCLKFVLSQATNVTLDQLRINVASLIQHETNLSAKAKLYISLWHSDSIVHEELREQTTFSLHDLRVAVLRACRSLRNMDEVIDGASPVNIVIDGHGRPVGYTGLGSSDVIHLP